MRPKAFLHHVHSAQHPAWQTKPQAESGCSSSRSRFRVHLCVCSVVITDNDHTLMPCRSSSSTRFTSSMRRTSCCTSLRCGALALYDALTARSDPAPSFATQACVYCPVTSAVFAEQLGHCQRGAQEKYNFKAPYLPCCGLRQPRRVSGCSRLGPVHDRHRGVRSHLQGERCDRSHGVAGASVLEGILRAQ